MRYPQLAVDTALITATADFIASELWRSPDIICVIDGQYVGMEVKAPKGKQSDHQKEFQRILKRREENMFWHIPSMT